MSKFKGGHGLPTYITYMATPLLIMKKTVFIMEYWILQVSHDCGSTSIDVIRFQFFNIGLLYKYYDYDYDY